MKRQLLLAAVALIAASCGPREKAQSGPEDSVASSNKPELGEFGVETGNIDASVKPGDNFYLYANGAWLKTFKIPDEYSSYGSFTELAERSENRVRDIVDEAIKANAAPGTTTQKVADLYSSYLDVGAIEAKGLTPLADDLAAIEAVRDHDALARLLMKPGFRAASPVRAFVGVDAKRPEQYGVHLTQSGLGMPNRDYYVEEKFADKRMKYKAYIAALLAAAGSADAAAKADRIYALESEIASIHWEPAKRRNRDLTYNLKSRDDLKSFAPGISWDAYFDAAGLSDQSEFILREDDAVAKLAALIASTPIETWKDYLSYHLLNANADVLPVAFDDLNFGFFGTELRGAPAKRERWKRAIDSVNGALGEAVGQLYVERHFPAESKERMQALVANLIAGFEERLTTLAWMSEETRAQAKAKLAGFTAKIGYPDQWRDYSAFNVVAGDAYGNKKRADAFEWARVTGRLGGPVDRNEWQMNPQTVNAYYSPQLNEIVFPAAILQPPFFDPNADDAVNYGGIGAVIGHEIGHGFDDQGRKSDGAGVLRDWWTSTDTTRFEELTSRLGAQYSKFEPVPGFPINPGLTMGENVGDVGGLAMAHHAYHRSFGADGPPVIGGLTGDQRFFLAWAQIWRRAAREEAIKNQIATDSHSPAEFRVNGVVRNMDAWYEAFGVSEGEALYLPAEERLSIW